MRTLITLTLLVSVAHAADVNKGALAKNIHTIKFMSESLGQERAFNVLLPDDYETSTRRYPALYLLHGYGDDQNAWAFMTNLSSYGSHHNVIIVMPDASRSFYVNSAADPKAKFEDYIVKDLIHFVDGTFRTIPLPRSRAVAGLSMGGYGAAFLGLKYYRSFAALGSFSGAIAISHEAPPADTSNADKNRRNHDIQDIFGPKDSKERLDRDPFVLLEKVPPAQMPLIYLACGGQDFLLEQNRAFVKLLAEKKIPYE